MPSRYLGADPGFDATFQIRLGDVGRTWEVRAQGEQCHVRTSATREPDAVIGSDAATWIGLREGRLSGLDAFAQRRLYARGDLDLALGFEGLFHLPGDRPPLLQVTDIEIPGATIRSLVAGDGPEPVVCLHGLGSNKASFFETVSALTPDHTVHAIDLPGFGGSSKPARGAYDAPYFARAVLGYMDAVGLQSAHLVGNSMGGRIALELALADPDRAITVSLLAPALAFRKRRELVPLVKLVRPELAAIPHPMRTTSVRAYFWGLFARPERLDPAAADVAIEEFCRTYRSRSARIAFFAALRNIYLDAPHGGSGLWTRLTTLLPPALFVWGDSDRLVPARFSRHVARAVPSARQVILPECGHVPQVELADRTNALIRRHIARSAAARSLRAA
ncbi:MAG TPA: alpha/beta fold hydrolase [Solirubrobacterales bacterium]|nr:alpha/beta fold hydrolase [Solirubrobacterales bacterium]